MIAKSYKYIRVLSLDIVIGAMVLLRFFCLQQQVIAFWQEYVLLGIAVWVIYTVDHVRDSAKAPDSTRFRYTFHRKNRKWLVILVVGLLVVALALLPAIPLDIILGGAVLMALSLLYLHVQSRLNWLLSKELFVSVVYAAGISLVPCVRSGFVDCYYVLLLLIASFVNLILFSRYEERYDRQDGFSSLATKLPAASLDKLLLILLCVGLSLSVLHLNLMGLYFVLALVVFFLIFTFSHWFMKKERFRSIGDGVFLLPLVFEWL